MWCLHENRKIKKVWVINTSHKHVASQDQRNTCIVSQLNYSYKGEVIDSKVVIVPITVYVPLYLNVNVHS